MRRAHAAMKSDQRMLVEYKPFEPAFYHTDIADWGMALELARHRIRVNAILPGTFATPPMLMVKERAPAVFAGLEASVPFPKRLGKPEEFASLVLELARNTYFNGQCIRIDGAIRMPPK